MSREVDKLVFDTVKALEAIEAFTAGLDFPAFLQSDVIQSAVEREFEIVGES
ncbi:MAG: hypothetical protein IPG72_03625 [Ardenticatenales bacterium]|jgi:uncharacterized protein with HEPN domain|nr:hypothetical protein [Ardenticatenales bacterium]